MPNHDAHRERPTERHFTPAASDKQGGVWIIRGGVELARPGSRMLAYSSLHFVMDGAGVFKSGSSLFHLSKGDVFAIFPNLIHSVEAAPGCELRTDWVAFHGPQASSLMRQIGLTEHHPHQSAALSEQVERLLLAIEQWMNESGSPSQLEALGMFYLLLAELKKGNDNRSRQTIGGHHDWLQKALDYIHANYVHITVQEVADYVNMSRYHFSNTFSKVLSISPKKYVDAVKMKKAASLLTEHTDMPVSDIALFFKKDIFAFSRAFKNFYGVSPTEYREQFGSPHTSSGVKPLPKIGTVVCADTFDDQPVGVSPRDYAVFGSTVTVERAPELIGHAMCIASQATGSVFAEREFPPVSDRLSLTLRIMVRQTTSPIAIHLFDQSNRPVIRVSLNHFGMLSFTHAQTWTQSVMEYHEHVWHHLEIIANLADGTYDFHFNNRPVAMRAKLDPASRELAKLRLGIQQRGSVFFDDVSVMRMLDFG
ncbi:AraC family transcriptional regulator [Paenibacillus sp. PL2-23]|uniref:AraC family transcriptional regulator n=1 Tax=Paenibacillus sp. PL2-23 TaxID=2100729 RepID=UPI0030FC80A7